MILTKVSLHKEYVLVETEVIDFNTLKKEIVMNRYFVVEIHDTESDKIGVLMHIVDGEDRLSKFDSFSQANVQAALLKENLTENLYTKIVSYEVQSN